MSESRSKTALTAGEASPGWSDERARREQQIIGWLAELALRTISRNEDPEDTENRFRLYAGDLLQYPMPSVRKALADWPNQSDRDKGRYFPTWSELKAKLTDFGRAPEHHAFLPSPSRETDPAIAAKMHRLARAVKNGEDLTALKAAGEI